MLSEIYIKNYILVPEVRISIGAGLTVITGETGAGKSILVGSIALIFGENASGIEAWDPSHPIYLEATFIPVLDEELAYILSQINIPSEEEIVLAREIHPSGKSTYYIGGRKVSQAVIKSLKPLLMDFHHQRDQQKLLSPAFQLEVLDAFAGATEKRKEFASAFKLLKKMKARLQEMQIASETQQQLIELYRYQFQELETADLKAGEDLSLQQEYEMLSHSQEILSLAANVNQSLFENEQSLYDILKQYANQLLRFTAMNNSVLATHNSILEAMSHLMEASSSLSNLLDGFSDDPTRMEVVSTRLDLINALLHKHKVLHVEDLLQLFASRAKELEAAENFDIQIANMKQDIALHTDLLISKTDQLSQIRSSGALGIAKELQKSIRHLNMENAELQIVIDKKATHKNIQSDVLATYTESGQDHVEFLFSANPGSSLKPLANVASGGELSRILLGIKQVLVNMVAPKLLILDEIDAGIGGKTAEMVADCIAAIAVRQPVLCITHLAQIAAVAHTHIAVNKESDDKTCVNLKKLNIEERTIELARMLSGNITPAALKHAQELIKT